MNRKNLEAKINAHAWKNSDFKKKLLSHPKEALKELKIEIDEETKIRVVEERKDEWMVVLQATPITTEKLSEDDLAKIAAAGLTTSGVYGNYHVMC